jgi:hypothetical protein
MLGMLSKPLDALTRFEALAERWLEGGIARLFRARLHRAEVAEQLARALEDGRTVGPDGVWLAPDDYHVSLHPDDYAQLGNRQDRAEVTQALASYLVKVAQQNGATLLRRPEIHLHRSNQVSPRQISVQAHLTVPETLAEAPPDTQEIEAQRTQGSPDTTASSISCHLLIGDRRFALNASPVSLGRSLDNDVVIDHPRVSRHHVQLRQRDGLWWLIDLGSANGTAVNDQPVSEAVLQPGDVISLAGFEIRFEMQASMAN